MQLIFQLIAQSPNIHVAIYDKIILYTVYIKNENSFRLQSTLILS